jgi:hypothetical protein
MLAYNRPTSHNKVLLSSEFSITTSHFVYTFKIILYELSHSNIKISHYFIKLILNTVSIMRQFKDIWHISCNKIKRRKITALRMAL